MDAIASIVAALILTGIVLALYAAWKDEREP